MFGGNNTRDFIYVYGNQILIKTETIINTIKSHMIRLNSNHVQATYNKSKVVEYFRKKMVLKQGNIQQINIKVDTV